MVRLLGQAVDQAYVGLWSVLAQGGPFEFNPEGGDAPGASGIQDAINAIGQYALLAAIAGFLIGAGVWAVGGRIGNDYTATGGKIGMVVSIAVAFLVGAATVILNWSYGLGSES